MDEDKKVYMASDVQKILGLGRAKTYQFLDEVYKKKKPFRVIKFGKLYRIHKPSFDAWLNAMEG